jgi:hypothetical protein
MRLTIAEGLKREAKSGTPDIDNVVGALHAFLGQFIALIGSVGHFDEAAETWEKLAPAERRLTPEELRDFHRYGHLLMHLGEVLAEAPEDDANLDRDTLRMFAEALAWFGSTVVPVLLNEVRIRQADTRKADSTFSDMIAWALPPTAQRDAVGRSVLRIVKLLQDEAGMEPGTKAAEKLAAIIDHEITRAKDGY